MSLPTTLSIILIERTGQLLVAPAERQWAHTPDVLLNHPVEQTDSFVLFIKASILMSKVKCFNLRFRAKNFAGDPQMQTPSNNLHPHQQTQAYIDPRESEGFKEIDSLVSAFVSSFPRGWNDPVRDGIVDVHMLLACVAPNVFV